MGQPARAGAEAADEPIGTFSVSDTLIPVIMPLTIHASSYRYFKQYRNLREARDPTGYYLNSLNSCYIRPSLIYLTTLQSLRPTGLACAISLEHDSTAGFAAKAADPSVRAADPSVRAAPSFARVTGPFP